MLPQSGSYSLSTHGTCRQDSQSMTPSMLKRSGIFRDKTHRTPLNAHRSTI